MSKRIYVPTSGVGSWRELLADPVKHWRQGYSARALAACWEAADGWPPEIAALLATATEPVLAAAELLLAIPEYQVGLPPRGRPSQNDLFALAKAANGELVALTIEGKVNEPFGPTIAEWNVAQSPGRKERLRFICEQLSLPDELPGSVRYQLLHRTVSALLLARRFNARYALMVVHSFSPTAAWFEDFLAFVAQFGSRQAERDILLSLTANDQISILAGWASGDLSFLQG
jgi:hypothetical protein